MKHRTIDYAVAEVEPGRWGWTIHAVRDVVGGGRYRSRELAVEACINEINNGIERTRMRASKV
jgi:hypothetical protein